MTHGPQDVRRREHLLADVSCKRGARTRLLLVQVPRRGRLGPLWSVREGSCRTSTPRRHAALVRQEKKYARIARVALGPRATSCLVSTAMDGDDAASVAAGTTAELLGPDAGATAHYEARVHGRRVPLVNVDRPAPAPATPLLQSKRERALRRRGARSAGPSRRAPRTVPRRERVLPDEPLTWAQVQPLHELWTAYVHGLLCLDATDEASVRHALENASWVQSVQSALVKADWAGGIVTGTWRACVGPTLTSSRPKHGPVVGTHNWHDRPGDARHTGRA